MSKLYEIVIFTASLSLYADPLLDVIDPFNYASYRLFRDHCTLYNNTFVKDLSNLGRDLKDVIIVDNYPVAYLFQPENAIPIPTWIDDLKDRKLIELTTLLELMIHIDDIRSVIIKNVYNNTMDYLKVASALQRNLDPIVKLRPLINAWLGSNAGKKAALMRKAKSLSDINDLQESENGEKILDKSTSELATSKIGKLSTNAIGPSISEIDKDVQSNKDIYQNDITDMIEKKPFKWNIVQDNADNNPLKIKHKRNNSKKRSKCSTPMPRSISSSKRKETVKYEFKQRDKPTIRHTHSDQYFSETLTLLRSTTPNKKHDKKESITNTSYGYFAKSHDKSTSKENILTSIVSPKFKNKPWITTGNNIFRGLEESANRKLNKHSSSLDNTDWIACYEKLRKDHNPSSRKDTGRISASSIRVDGCEKKTPKQSLIRVEAQLKKSTNMIKAKSRLALNTERFRNAATGRRTVLNSDTPKSVIFLHKKK